MAKSKETAPQGGGRTGAARLDKETPVLCVCGRAAITVRYRGKKMLSCPAQDKCAMRSRWCSNERDAIHDWNNTVQAARYKGKGGEKGAAS